MARGIGHQTFFFNGGQVSFCWLGPLREEGLRPLLTWLEALLCYAFARHRLRGRGAEWAVLAMVCSLGLAAVAGIASFLRGGTEAIYSVERAVGLFTGSNVLAGFLLFGQPLVWVAAVAGKPAEPVTGIGLGSFFRDLHLYYPDWIVPREPHEHAHNMMLQVAAEQGLAATGLLLMVFFRVLHHGRVLLLRRSLLAGAYLALLATWVQSLFDYTQLVASLACCCWILIAMVVNGTEARDQDLRVAASNTV